MPIIEKYLEYPQDTRWATDEEIMSPLSSSKIDIANPPFAAAGLILKSDGKTVYVDGLDHHSMILGSTGSGKSRLLCMPMIGIMANAGESFIATDPKGELFKMTSGFAREQGYQVVILNFRDVSSGDMWNPLLIPYELYQHGSRDQAMSLVNDLVMTLTAADGGQEKFWTQMAQSLILANILLLFETGKREEINMHSLSRLCLDYGRPKSQNALYQILEYMNPDSIAAMNYAGVCVDAEKTQSSIMGVVHSALRVFCTQEGLLRMMSDSTFDMRSFGRTKTAVYLVIPDEKSTFHFLVSTFTKQCYEMLISEAHKEADMMLPVRVNFLLDEFANLPTIPDMPNMISAARSRNIRFHLVIQNMNQLHSKYGNDAATISSNCENWVYLNSKEYDCLEEISKRCGNLLDNRNQLRPLITPSRLQRLDKERGEALIFHGRHYPYITYLADISRYDFKVYSPAEVQPIARKPGRVFHVDQILKELKTGKRAPLFYVDYEEEKDSLLKSVDTDKRETGVFTGKENGVSSRWETFEQTDGSAEDRLKKLSEKRMELSKTLSADLSGKSAFWLLFYLLHSQSEMACVRMAMNQDRVLYEKLNESYRAEDTYRNTEAAACCALLLGDGFQKQGDKKKKECLFEQYTESILALAGHEQPLLFYPADSVRLHAAAAAGVAAAIFQIRRKEFSKAENILQYVGTYKDCFLRYPGLASLLSALQKLLDALRSGLEKDMAAALFELEKPFSFEEKELYETSVWKKYAQKRDTKQRDPMAEKQKMHAVLNCCKEEYRALQEDIQNGIFSDFQNKGRLGAEAGGMEWRR